MHWFGVLEDPFPLPGVEPPGADEPDDLVVEEGVVAPAAGKPSPTISIEHAPRVEIIRGLVRR